MTDKNFTDALGNPLVIGGLYGYSNTKSGSATTVIGRLEKIGGSRITIRIIKRRDFLYGQPIDRNWGAGKPTAGVNACILFPLAESVIREHE